MKQAVLLRGFFIFFAFLNSAVNLRAQCNNSDFENGTLSGWTGTWGYGDTSGACLHPNPFLTSGLNIGPVNGAPLDSFSHHIMTAGFDQNLGGSLLPVVYPGSGAYSAALGNMIAYGDAETISYTFLVTNSNCNFTYHYAVVINDGGHPTGEQPYFKIRMYTALGDTIDCATYDVDATTAQTIGGFLNPSLDVYYKPWSSVFIPLLNYIGQTVTITFITRACRPNGCNGKHWCYCYLDADCGPLNIISSIPSMCNGQNDTLTAPIGAATYSWTGPGVIPPGNGQTCYISQPGHYTVTMTTFGTVSCTFSLDTIIPGSLNNPIANFTTPIICLGTNTLFTDLSIPSGSITGWAWDFNNDGTTDATTQNPSYTFPAVGIYPVYLSVNAGVCTGDTTINVVVQPPPTSPFTATGPLCPGENATITYAGNAPGSAIYTWNFGGGNVVSGSGQGSYLVNWSSAGVQTITLSVNDNGCISPPFSINDTVNPIPFSNAGPDIGFCSGDTATIGAISTPGYSYSWLPVIGLSSSVVSNPSVNLFNLSNNNVFSNYIVTTTALNCSSTDTMTVTVYPIPMAHFTPPAGQCLTGNKFNFQGSGIFLPPATFLWDFGNNATPQNSFSQNEQVFFATTGFQTITWVITSEYGCVSNPYVDSIQIYAMPTVHFAADTFIGCENFDVCFINHSVSDTPSAYLWSFGDGGFSDLENPCHIYVAPGTYSIELQVISAHGCNDDSDVANMITVIADPVALFTLGEYTMQIPEATLACTNESRNASAFFWTFGNGFSSTEVNPQASYTVAGEYIIILVAYNQLGCPDTIQHPLLVLPPEQFFIPNAFTPNGDGNNDLFYIYSQAGVTVLQFQIFDRWGELVYEDLSPWDGTYKGKPAPPAVYVYVFRLGLVSSEVGIMRKGSVTLIR